MADGRGGARPGAGRPPGALNRATEDRAEAFRRVMNAAFGDLAPDIIDNISPAQLLRFAMRFAVKKGFAPEAIQIAEKAAPYFDRKLAPMEAQQSDEDKTVTIKGGLPED